MQGRAQVILDNLIAQGKAKPMIVAMPLGYGSENYLAGIRNPTATPEERDRWDIAVRDALLKEVLPSVERNYRVEADSKSRAIAGLSMGGIQAEFIGLNALDRFAWIGGFSAPLRGQHMPQEDYPGVDERANARIALLWRSCGTEDSLMTATRQLRDWLKSRDIKATNVDVPGGHTWLVFRRNLAAFAPLLFR